MDNKLPLGRKIPQTEVQLRLSAPPLDEHFLDF